MPPRTTTPYRSLRSWPVSADLTNAPVPRSPAALASELAALIAPLAEPTRVLLDGVGSAGLADSLVEGLRDLGRVPVRISAADFLRPAGVRFEYGREDEQAFREVWLDDGALRREVLGAPGGSYLPSLWDAGRDRSTRATALPLPPRAVLLVDGVLLLGRGLPAELTVHVALSPAALTRRGIPAWQLPAFATYAEDVRPAQHCDVLVRAEDPLRPAVVVHPGSPGQVSR